MQKGVDGSGIKRVREAQLPLMGASFWPMLKLCGPVCPQQPSLTCPTRVQAEGLTLTWRSCRDNHPGWGAWAASPGLAGPVLAIMSYSGGRAPCHMPYGGMKCAILIHPVHHCDAMFWARALCKQLLPPSKGEMLQCFAAGRI